MDLGRSTVIDTRNVVFREISFPFLEQAPKSVPRVKIQCDCQADHVADADSVGDDTISQDGDESPNFVAT